VLLWWWWWLGWVDIVGGRCAGGVCWCSGRWKGSEMSGGV